MANTYLTKTFAQAGNRKKFTISTWIKRSELVAQGSSAQQDIIACSTGASTFAILYFASNNDSLTYYEAGSGSTQAYIDHTAATNFKLSDPNAWYHIVFTHDSTQNTASDRLKMYVNGTQLTPSNSTYPSQDHDSLFNTAIRHDIGAQGSGFSNGTNSFNGYMSHFHFCDGYAYSPSDFGSTDATTGEWQINTNPNVNYGTNGFFVLKDGNSVTDSSSNSNAWAVGQGTLTKSEDNPSNNFATWNYLVPTGGGFQGNSSTHRYGNNDFVTNNSSSNYGTTWSTLGMTSGKYYMEVHYESNSNQGLIGIIAHYPTSTANYIGGNSNSWGLYPNGQYYNGGGGGNSYGTAWTNGDYIGVFLDLDNNKLYYSKNGVVMNSGTGISITAASSTETGVYHFACNEWNSTGNGDFGANFGNGSFRTTQLTGTTYQGADGNGIFKYNPNNITLDGSSKSFKSLSTKGLNS